ncbi:unnamed protein product [Psylliodes chrysocephalus]|uniref:DUF4371 domain-containing protein n=1 Tax=Psylliodes chrysocephalus TaxID=3402493 RepID=A0A9P0DA22_9CUCU|nr:unnamed protein product [Psylliodes chrysocephala]
MEILESYNIIFNKSQVPKIKEKKEQAYKDIHQKYILQIGRDLTEKQLKKKIQNIKTELKKKTDKTATGNKKIVLNAWEKQLLVLMERQENPVFQKVPGAMSIGSVMEQPQPSTSKTEEFIPTPPHVRPLPDKSPVTRRTKFKETDETSNLSNTELQLLVLLEQLELIRVQKEKEKILLEKIQKENGNQFEEIDNLLFRKFKRGFYARYNPPRPALRFCDSNGLLVEQFVGFQENVRHGAKELEDTFLNILKSMEIPLKDCRGQSYDNASNMSGKYSELQARIKA